MNEQQFRQFLADLRAGKSDAWEKLVAMYELTLRGCVRRFLARCGLRRGQDSADVWQAVLVNLLKTGVAGTFESEAALRRYLLTMALNDAITRGRKKGPDQLGIEEVRDLKDKGSSPSQHVEREDALEQLRERLSPDHRQIFCLKEEQGLSWEEILERVGIHSHRLAAVRVRYRRSLDEAVRELKLEDGIDEHA